VPGSHRPRWSTRPNSSTDAGEKLAFNRLGVLLADCGRLDEAEDYYRRAIDAGIAVAWGNLARLVMRRDPTAASGHGTHAEQVLDLLEHGAQAGDVEALIVLGTRAVERDDAADAERYFGQAAESGSTTAHVLLLIVVAGQGRPAQTQALVDQIVADDDQVALDTLERMTVFVGVPEVLAALRNTGSTRDPAAWHRVADLLAAMG
jgi:TPR repeat protein